MFSPRKEMRWLSDVIKVLANTTVGVILQHINVSNQHATKLKLTQCYMTIVSQQKKFFNWYSHYLQLVFFSGFTMSLTLTNLPIKRWEVDTPARIKKKKSNAFGEK